jgi:hypothetical protein
LLNERLLYRSVIISLELPLTLSRHQKGGGLRVFRGEP